MPHGCKYSCLYSNQGHKTPLLFSKLVTTTKSSHLSLITFYCQFQVGLVSMVDLDTFKTSECVIYNGRTSSLTNEFQPRCTTIEVNYYVFLIVDFRKIDDLT